MNCSDNVSSDVVLPEEIILSASQTGMGYAHMHRLSPVVKWESNDLIIIYDSDVSFHNVFSGQSIVSFTDEYAGGKE